MGKCDELREWLSHCRSTYQREHQTVARSNYLEPSGFFMPSGWVFLEQLTGCPNAKLAACFLARIEQGEFCDRLKFSHSTTPDRYPKTNVSHPLPWLVLKHGMVQVGNETTRLAAIVAKRQEPALTKIPDWQTLLPTLEKLVGVDGATPATPSDFRSLWLALIKQLANAAALQDDSLRELWAGAAKDGVVPASLSAEAGEIPLSQILVTGSPDLARRARTPSRIVVTLDDAALTL